MHVVLPFMVDPMRLLGGSPFIDSSLADLDYDAGNSS